MPPINRSVCLLIIICLSVSCSQRKNIKQHGAIELADLSNHTNFQLTGKMSFSDGQEGGSGRVNWIQNNGLINATLKAPLGSKSWHIIESETQAKLITEQGDVIYGDTTDVILSDQLGWQVPWQQLKTWVQGKPHDDELAKIIWSDDAYTLSEGGWQIEYSKLKQYPVGVLPHKMMARNNDYSIKLVVKQWSW
ncbi:MAG: lipoprotein insertase outer membrane protein LolB [Marinicella sp.]